MLNRSSSPPDPSHCLEGVEGIPDHQNRVFSPGKAQSLLELSMQFKLRNDFELLSSQPLAQHAQTFVKG